MMTREEMCAELVALCDPEIRNNPNEDNMSYEAKLARYHQYPNKLLEAVMRHYGVHKGNKRLKNYEWHMATYEAAFTIYWARRKAA